METSVLAVPGGYGRSKRGNYSAGYIYSSSGSLPDSGAAILLVLSPLPLPRLREIPFGTLL